jgi:hypothetical protein
MKAKRDYYIPDTGFINFNTKCPECYTDTLFVSVTKLHVSAVKIMIFESFCITCKTTRKIVRVNGKTMSL